MRIQDEERRRREQKEEEERVTRERTEHLTKIVGIPPRFSGKTLDNFHPADDDQARAFEVACNYAREFDANLREGRCLVFCGDPGRGKTHLALGIVDSLLSSRRRPDVPGWSSRYSIRYRSVQQLIRVLRDSWRKESKITEQQQLDEFCGLDLLVLDEVGIQYGTDAEKVQLFEVIDGRYKAVKPTLLISNLSIDGVTEHLGDRLVDRLRENGGQVVVFKGKSYRAKK